MTDDVRAQRFAQMAEDWVADPDTRAVQLVAVGPELGSMSVSIADDDPDREARVANAAVALREHVDAADADPEAFLRDVVREFNERRYVETEGDR